MSTITLDPLSERRGIDLDKLQTRYPALYKIVVRQTGKTTGVHALDFNLFLAGSHRYLAECAVPLSEPQIDMDGTLREEQADVQRRADEAAGRNRLELYAREQGLEDTQRNADLIKQWLQENVKGYVSEKTIDVAIQWLGPRSKNVLTWKPKTVAPSPPAPEPQEPAEVLVTLPDGTKQLPLDVDNRTLQRASKEQARDWLKRANAGKLLRPRGGFGSKF